MVNFILKKRNVLFHILVSLFTYGIWVIIYWVAWAYNKNSKLKFESSQFSTNYTPIYDNSLKTNTFVAFDLETTGLSPKENKIIEIGAVKYINGIKTDTFENLINPLCKNEAYEINHISDETLIDKPTIDFILPNFKEFIENFPLVSYNAKFDIDFLYNNNFYTNSPIVDALALSRAKLKGLKNYKLKTVCKYLNINLLNAHRALDDAIATAIIYTECCKSTSTIDTKNDSSFYQKKAENFKKEELEIFEVIKQILISNKKDITGLYLSRTGTYLDICFHYYTFLRCKLNGKLKYIISRIPLEELQKEIPNFILAPVSKNEMGNTRIMINSFTDELPQLESILISAFEETHKQYEDYLNPKYISGVHANVNIDPFTKEVSINTKNK